MSIFNVELKKVVDDTYDIEIGYNLSDTLVSDLENGLAGKIKKFAVLTDTKVRDPYALPICEKIKHAGYSVLGKRVCHVRHRQRLRMPCLKRGTEETAVSLQSVAVW